MTIWGARRGWWEQPRAEPPPWSPPRPPAHLAAHAEPEALVLAGDAANHGHCADAQGFPKFDGFLLNLLCQLTGGGQDDGVGPLV